MRIVARLILVVLIAFAMAAIAGYAWLNDRVHAPVSAGLQSYTIDPGSGLSQVARDLAREGVLGSPWPMMVWARKTGVAGRIHAGEYRIEPDITVARLLDRFANGDVIQHSITLIEGWTFAEVLDALGRNGRITTTLSGMSGSEIMAALGRPGVSPEGMIFPDTYRFTANTTDLSILSRALERMENELEDAWAGRDQALPIDDPYEALILASIIEKETGRSEERGKIAGVFINRLRRGMKLQTDPTVIYGLGDAFDGNLTRAHLGADNEYNTYTRVGLPPTPIAMPGRHSLDAAVNPEPTNAIYFVSRGDGTHEFSATLDEHNAAVRKYQLNRG